MTSPPAPAPCPWPAWLLLAVALLGTETARCWLAVLGDLAAWGLESLGERLRARIFEIRVTGGVVALLVRWPLWLLCIVLDAMATRGAEERDF